MADANGPIDDAISQLQTGEHFARFLAQLDGLTESLAAMTATTSRLAAEANENLAKSLHPSTGRSGSRSPTASTHPETPLEHLLPKLPLPKSSRDAAREVLSGRATAIGADGHEYESGNVGPVKVWGNKELGVKDRLKLSAGSASSRVNNALHGRHVDANDVMAYSYLYSQLRGEGQRIGSWMEAKNPQAVGSQLGYARDGTDFGLPFQIPGTQLVTEAGRKGATEWAKRKWTAWKTPGLGTGDIGEIQGALYKQGWVEGDARDRMMDGLVGLKQRYKGMNTEAAASMIDQGTRYGNAHVQDMVGILKEVPEAARAAGLGMNEMLDAINEVANASQKQGATYKQGAAFAAQALAVTGRDPRLQQQLSENNFVQSRVLAQTGILPQAQGALDPNERLSLNAKSLREQFNIYRGMQDRKRKDPLTGETYTISGEDQAMAMVAEQTGLSVDAIKSQLKDEKRQTLLNQLTTSTRVSSKRVGDAARSGDFEAAKNSLIDTTALDKMREQGVMSEKDVTRIYGAAEEAMMRADKETDPKRRAQILAEAASEKLSAVKSFTKDSTKDTIEKGAGKDRNEVKLDLTDRAARLLKRVTTGDSDTKLDSFKDVAKAGGQLLLDSPASKIARLGPAAIPDLFD